MRVRMSGSVRGAVEQSAAPTRPRPERYPDNGGEIHAAAICGR